LSLNLLYDIEDTLISQGGEKISVEASGKEQTIINKVYNFVSTFKANLDGGYEQRFVRPEINYIVIVAL
jgi:hypothetical protein